MSHSYDLQEHKYDIIVVGADGSPHGDEAVRTAGALAQALDTLMDESRERVLSALRNSGVRVPAGRITVNLAPAGIRKEGASFDLAIAMGIVAAGGRDDRPPAGLDGLSLDDEGWTHGSAAAAGPRIADCRVLLDEFDNHPRHILAGGSLYSLQPRR